MIPPHLLYQIYLSFLEQNYCTPPKCGELSIIFTRLVDSNTHERVAMYDIFQHCYAIISQDHWTVLHTHERVAIYDIFQHCYAIISQDHWTVIHTRESCHI